VPLPLSDLSHLSDDDRVSSVVAHGAEVGSSRRPTLMGPIGNLVFSMLSLENKCPAKRAGDRPVGFKEVAYGTEAGQCV
jgi:hypothetical protein